MKIKIPFLFVAGLLLINVLSNSCKKDNQNTVHDLFTAGKWQLASISVTSLVGDTIKTVDTLNTKCDTTQFFTFRDDNTCSYTNFDCLHNAAATGTWQLSADKLYLSSNMVCKDTTAIGSSKPFASAKIENVGQYSLVLLTGDTPTHTANSKRRVTRYAFVRQKTSL